MSTRVCFVSLGLYAYFNPEATETAGGAERQLYLLSQKLSDWFEMHAVVGDYGQPKREVLDGVVLHRAYSPDQNTSSLAQPLELVKLGLAMKRADADVYVYRGHPRKAGVVALIARLLRKKFIYNLANDPNVTDQRDSLSFPFRSLFDWGVKNAKTVIAQTSKQQQLIRERFETDCTVVPNGYPTVNETLSHEERGPAIWVGRFDPNQKRPHLFLDLAERLPDYEFLLIGPEGLDKEYYERVVERAAVLDNVTYVGPVAPDDIHDYYRQASVLVNTSSHEGFPNTFLEAWRYATPVVSLNVDPARYLNVSLEGYAEGDMEDLETLAGSFLTDTERRRAVGKQSKKSFEAQYSLQTVASRYNHIIKRFVE